MKVCVALYEHRYGKDVVVFTTEDAAFDWRDEIARREWPNEIGSCSMPMPDQDRVVGEAYFEIMGERADKGEWFYIFHDCEVES